MFKSARLKLTGWYLLIVMLISLFFSGLIYIGTIRELERGFRWGEIRLKARELDVPLPQHFSGRFEDLPPRLREGAPRFLLGEDLETAKKRLGLQLLVLNGFILIFSAGASWFLAGKTLRPIEQALEEQKRFVADASHELRSPLTALKTSMEVALRDKKMATKEAKKILKENLEEVDGLQSITDNLLSLAKYQRADKDFVFEKVSLDKIVERAAKTVRPLAKKKGVTLKLKIGDLALMADKPSLEKMMTIFLDNAIKFTPEGGKVTVSAKRDKKYVFIKVKDTGIGIPKKDLAHIFDRFYQVDKSRSKIDVPGYGLGLSLAKRIIEIHKGSVNVSSMVGKGTTFTIKLPLKHS